MCDLFLYELRQCFARKRSIFFFFLWWVIGRTCPPQLVCLCLFILYVVPYEILSVLIEVFRNLSCLKCCLSCGISQKFRFVHYIKVIHTVVKELSFKSNHVITIEKCLHALGVNVDHVDVCTKSLGFAQYGKPLPIHFQFTGILFLFMWKMIEKSTYYPIHGSTYNIFMSDK